MPALKKTKTLTKRPPSKAPDVPIKDRIEGGEFDKELRAIVRAAYRRRAVMIGADEVSDVGYVGGKFARMVQVMIDNGYGEDDKADVVMRWFNDGHRELQRASQQPDSNGVPQAQPTQTASAAPASFAAQHVSRSDGPAIYNAYCNSPVTLINGQLTPLQGRFTGNTATWNQKRYAKASIVGQIIRVPSDYKTVALRDCRLYIAGVGDTTFKVLLLDRPKNSRGGYNDKFGNDEFFYLPRNVVFLWLVEGITSRKGKTP